MPLLNGQRVEATAIDPTRHRYVGMFRPPMELCCNDSYCRCGMALRGSMGMYPNWIHEHYLMGHFDEPQYEDKKHSGAR